MVLASNYQQNMKHELIIRCKGCKDHGIQSLKCFLVLLPKLSGTNKVLFMYFRIGVKLI